MSARLCSWFFDADGIGFLIHFSQAHFDEFGARRGKTFSDVIWSDRKFTMTPVDQDGVLNSVWTSEGANRIHGGTAGSTREQDIVDEDQG